MLLGVGGVAYLDWLIRQGLLVQCEWLAGFGKLWMSLDLQLVFMSVVQNKKEYLCKLLFLTQNVLVIFVSQYYYCYFRFY